MGMKLTAFFEQANKDFGIQGRMKLAMLTKIPSSQAETLPDSPDNLKKFDDALKQIKQGK